VTVLRFEHVGVIVDDLDAATAFFLAVGFEADGGRGFVEGEWVDEIVGLEGVRSELQFVRTPDGSGALELVKFHSPADEEGAQALPANRLGYRHLAIQVDDVNAIVERLRDEGYETVGEVRDYADVYRIVYVRGPEGLIVELAERLGR
jgi:catechol 2,3-dioxygenase-like lactoylglutathione lyase family enzyme